MPTIVAWSLVLLVGLQAADIDDHAIANPQLAVAGVREAEFHWQALFEPMPRSPLRHLVALSQELPDRYPSLLAARLLYRGDPWTRRGDEAGISQSEWRRRCEPVLVAVLQELRLRQDPDIEPVLIAYLQMEEDPVLVTSALVNLIHLVPATGEAGAIRIADPRHAEALPGSRHPGARRQALELIVGHRGLSDAEARTCLHFALANGTPGERLAALRLVPRGGAPELLVETASRMTDPQRAGKLLDEDLDCLAELADRLPSPPSPQLAANMLRLALASKREVALAACAYLTRGLPEGMPLPIDAFKTRMAESRDKALRHALLHLVLRVRPEGMAEVAPAGSPWRRLAEHRERLAAWEWKGR